MKIYHAALVAAFLSLTSAGFAFDLPGLDKVPGVAGLPAVSFPRIAGSEIVGSAEAAAERSLEALRAEAAADPDKFVDEHTPEEVGLVFGLPAGSRYMISNALALSATVQVRVNLGTQRLTVSGPGVGKVFKISSGLAPEHGTPGSGKCFAPDFIETMHYSSLYNKAPMPNSVFFNGNIAMHGTEAEHLLGKPASHGCIRLSKADAKTLFDIIKANGKVNTSICVEGKTPVK
ncbi:MAG: L,D-transpeptidase [Elusimicrobiota bacterium]|nr:L,D-transpeptidase [Elusimicrobiota bacterium]